MLDADSVIAPGFFDACERAMASGARRGAGAQREQPRPHAGHGGLARRLHAAGHHASRAAATASGSPCACAAPGWRSAATWRSHTASARRPPKISFFTLDLLLDGRPLPPRRRRPARAPRARARWGTFGSQKLRYEAGRMAAARAYVPRLLRRAIRHRDAACLEAAWFLATPPFALGALSLLLGVALAAIARRLARRRACSALGCSCSRSRSSPA